MILVFVCCVTYHSEVFVVAAWLHLPWGHCGSQILMTESPFSALSHTERRLLACLLAMMRPLRLLSDLFDQLLLLLFATLSDIDRI